MNMTTAIGPVFSTERFIFQMAWYEILCENKLQFIEKKLF
jgi:hypothetical protein